MWIAKDKNGWVNIFQNKPVADAKGFFQVDDENWCSVDQDLFPELTFENSPKELVIKD